MKKQILNLGKPLNKAQQKSINGGRAIHCYDHIDCPYPMGCCSDKTSHPFTDMGICMTPDDYSEGCEYGV